MVNLEEVMHKNGHSFGKVCHLKCKANLRNIFVFTLPDLVSQVWVGRSEYYFIFIFSGFI